MPWRFLLILAVAYLVVQPSRGCSQPDGYVPWNISDRVQAAEMVVWGRVIAKHGLKTPPTTSYTAEVEYGCHVKGDSTVLHPRFNVTKMGVGNQYQCVAHNVDVGAYYFFFLQFAEEEVLIPQDINQQSAVVSDSQENRLEFSLCCGFTLSVCRPEYHTTSQPHIASSTPEPRTSSQPQALSPGTNGPELTVAMTTMNVAMTTRNLTENEMSSTVIPVGGASHMGTSAISVFLSFLLVVLQLSF